MSSKISNRNLIACDPCHKLKLKCVALTYECARCKRLKIHCTFERRIHKRGRKPAGASPLSPDDDAQGDFPLEYPVLKPLEALGICKRGSGGSIHTEHSTLCSSQIASQLLDHFYSSPNHEFHTKLIRKRNLLSYETPRQTSAALLCSMLCVACYMPRSDRSSPIPIMSNSQLIALRRGLLAKTIKLLPPILITEVEPSFDDAITSFMLASIGPSEDVTDLHMQEWLTMLKLYVTKLALNVEFEGDDEEEKEERRRLWWCTFIVDRHASLSFNLRPQFTDLECQNLQRPCPDEIWETSLPLTGIRELLQPGHNLAGANYMVTSIDFIGLILPLSRILGDILEFHFLRQHPTFNSKTAFLDDIRLTIANNLSIWAQSLESRLNMLSHGGLTASSSNNDSSESKQHENAFNPKDSESMIVLYGKHLFHCMHVLLYGMMDLVEMYEDITWQTSPEFLQATEHANHCAELCGRILSVDPHLYFMYRFFGTYLLQSSFIFLLLAEKLRSAADDLILKNCTINLRALEAFVQITNIMYQRTFAGVLRHTILERLRDRDPDVDPGEQLGVGVGAGLGQGLGQGEPREGLDLNILKYRWVAGHNGLWGKSMKPP